MIRINILLNVIKLKLKFAFYYRTEEDLNVKLLSAETKQSVTKEFSSQGLLEKTLIVDDSKT